MQFLIALLYITLQINIVEGVIPVGRLEINPIEKLLRIGLLPGGSNEEQAVINDIDFSMLDIHEGYIFKVRVANFLLFYM